ncbi:MAG: glycine/sarcosine/betaine reductase selenoprotein B family protein [Alphaproteobacteria bacterium]
MDKTPQVMDSSQPPLSYTDMLREKYGSMGFPAYKWTVNEDAPFVPLAKPLAECRVSMLCSGGISLKSAPAWNPDARNDLRLDAIPSDSPSTGFQVHDNYYNDENVMADLNCLYPIDRLREFAADGTIGEVAPRLWSGFMGRTYIRRQVRDEAGPAFAAELKKDGVDLLVAVPACPLDHQTVGIVARVVEEAGIPTVTVSVGRDISSLVRPPRTVFANFPMGAPFGRPGEVELQRSILRDALELAASATEPGIFVDLPYDFGAPWDVTLGNMDPGYQQRK